MMSKPAELARSRTARAEALRERARNSHIDPVIANESSDLDPHDRSEEGSLCMHVCMRVCVIDVSECVCLRVHMS